MIMWSFNCMYVLVKNKLQLLLKYMNKYHRSAMIMPSPIYIGCGRDLYFHHVNEKTFFIGLICYESRFKVSHLILCSRCHDIPHSKVHGPTWGPSGSCWPQMGPMLDPWILLSGRLKPSVKNSALVYHGLVHLPIFWSPYLAFIKTYEFMIY